MNIFQFFCQLCWQSFWRWKLFPVPVCSSHKNGPRAKTKIRRRMLFFFLTAWPTLRLTPQWTLPLGRAMYSHAGHRGRRLSGGRSCHRTSARVAANGGGSPSTPGAAAAGSSRRVSASILTQIFQGTIGIEVWIRLKNPRRSRRIQKEQIQSQFFATALFNTIIKTGFIFRPTPVYKMADSR